MLLAFVAALALVGLAAFLYALHRKDKATMADLTALTASVTANTTVTGSVLTLLQGLSAQLKAAGTDPAALASLQSQIDANTAAMTAAVSTNTPAAAQPTGAASPAVPVA
jgi:hypothetical protein